MRNLVRGGFILSLIGMFVVLVYAQAKTEKVLSSANDSQLKLNTIDNPEVVADDKKLVKKTVSETKVVSAAASAGAVSKGSFSATAYCLKGRTAMGHGVRRGIIAADPRVLRLGSKVLLNAGGYTGQYIVSDTGGAVRGKEIDIWVPSCAEARRFGRRNVTVSLLPR
ncbi:MAG TPA: 3D domain-containing protein [Pyrinomonadaceae bacterium]|nr:3D domain-containing protein [Pyrinomonadaceae bacterium]